MSSDGGKGSDVRRCMSFGIACGFVLVIAAACGSDGDSQQSSDSFVADANGICADFFSSVKALAGPSFSNDEMPSSLDDDQIAEGIRFFEAYLEIENGQLDRLRQLQPPSDAKEQFKTFIDAWTQRRDAAEDALDAFEAREDEVYEKASSELTAAAFKGAAVAQTLGLETCQGEG